MVTCGVRVHRLHGLCEQVRRGMPKDLEAVRILGRADGDSARRAR